MPNTSNDMELVPKQFAWAGHANLLFSSYTEDVSFWSVLGTLSALEALFATMRYINWHFHLYLHLHLEIDCLPNPAVDVHAKSFMRHSVVHSSRERSTRSLPRWRSGVSHSLQRAWHVWPPGSGGLGSTSGSGGLSVQAGQQSTKHIFRD